ncbi:MAG TPA: hypothetical protein VFB22_13490 [Candidatus Baltobacteraceae bacterium]|nr:hypothetical protein [Candidatus Baltobacteraceae bacterium]
MNTNVWGAAAAGLLACALPLSAPAQTGAPKHYVFQTAMHTENRAGEVDGVLDINVYPDGIVQGTYRGADGGPIRSVAGGDKNGHIWFNVGPNGNLRVTGTLRDGVLRTVVERPGAFITTLDSTSVQRP